MTDLTPTQKADLAARKEDTRRIIERRTGDNVMSAFVSAMLNMPPDSDREASGAHMAKMASAMEHFEQAAKLCKELIGD